MIMNNKVYVHLAHTILETQNSTAGDRKTFLRESEIRRSSNCLDDLQLRLTFRPPCNLDTCSVARGTDRAAAKIFYTKIIHSGRLWDDVQRVTSLGFDMLVTFRG